MINDIYQRCRWCRNFANGKCTVANEVFEINSSQIKNVVDDGYLVSPLREILDRHLSIYALDVADIEYKIDTIITEIEKLVKEMPINSDEGLEVKDPSTNDHYCKRFE